MPLRNYKVDKSLRNSLFLSLILHTVIIIVLGFFIMESEQRKVKESVAVDMVNMAKNKNISIPRRVLENRESIINLKKQDEKLPVMQFKPREFKPSKTESLKFDNAPNVVTLSPMFGTAVSKIRSNFDAPLPSTTAIGVAIDKPGSGTGKAKIGSGGSLVGLMGGANIFEVALHGIARNIIAKNRTGKEDIVFLIDSSGSMEENITAVVRYIYKMLEVFEDSKLDFTLGVVRFNRILKVDDIKVYDQTRDINKFKSILRLIKCSGDESIFNAIEVGLTQVKFRDNTDKTLILVTDESMKPKSKAGQSPRTLPRKELIQQDLQEAINVAKSIGVKISVVAIEDEMHKTLAKETSGLWFPIPQQSVSP
jgi:hypothetical protein